MMSDEQLVEKSALADASRSASADDMAEPGTGRSVTSHGRFDFFVYVALIVGCFVYFMYCIGPELLYYQQTPVFLLTKQFLGDSLAQLGGLHEYAAAFIDQWMCIRWAGALILTANVAVTCWLWGYLLKGISGRRPRQLIAVLPGIGLLLLHNRFQYDLRTNLAIVLALGAAFVFCCFCRRWTKVAGWCFVLLALVLFYAAGSAVVLFAVTCLALELVRKPRWCFSIVAIVVCSLPAVFALHNVKIGVWSAYAPLLHHGDVPLSFWGNELLPMLMQIGCIAALPAMLLLAGVLGKRRARVLGRDSAERPAECRTGRKWRVLGSFVAVSSISVLLYISLDVRAKKHLEIGYFGQQQQWDVVLAKAEQLSPEAWTCYEMQEVNLALYRSGRLLNELCRYPQRSEVDGLLLEYAFGARPSTGRAYLRRAELYLSLGHVNRALVSAHAALEDLGPHPDALRLLAKIYLVKGRTRMAGACLVNLSANPLCRQEAADWIEQLDTDPDMSGNREIQQLRAVMVRADSPAETVDPQSHGEVFQMLLHTNRNNRMAFEYAMAYYLLSRQLDRLVVDLERLNDFDYDDLPIALQEAIVVHRKSHSDERIDMHGFHISSDVFHRGRAFFDACSPFVTGGQLDNDKAAVALNQPFGRSYFFYRIFHFCGYVVDTEDDAIDGNAMQ